MISYWNENRYSQLKNFSFWKGEKLNSSKFKALIAALAATQLRVLGKLNSYQTVCSPSGKLYPVRPLRIPIENAIQLLLTIQMVMASLKSLIKSKLQLLPVTLINPEVLKFSSRNELDQYEKWMKRQRRRFWSFKQLVSQPSVQGYLDNVWTTNQINTKIDVKEIVKNAVDILNLWNEIIRVENQFN